MSTEPKILLTGVTGFIGGSVLHSIIASDEDTLRNLRLSVLIRGEERGSQIKSAYGARVETILFAGLEDTDRIMQVASEHDIVFGMMDASHSKSACAILDGLAKRRRHTGRDTIYVHTSGTSNLADKPLTVGLKSAVEFDDMISDIYGFERTADEIDPYPQRTTELRVAESAQSAGVKHLIIMSPLIYGRGTGLFNKSSMHIPTLLKSALKFGRVPVIDDGGGVWDNVHIEDLAELYKLVLIDIFSSAGSNLPSGKNAIIFSGVGRHSWKELSQELANTLYAVGLVENAELQRLALSEAVHMTGGDIQMAELGLASNSKTKSSIARKLLGWMPVRDRNGLMQGLEGEIHLCRT